MTSPPNDGRPYDMLARLDALERAAMPAAEAGDVAAAALVVRVIELRCLARGLFRIAGPQRCPRCGRHNHACASPLCSAFLETDTDGPITVDDEDVAAALEAMRVRECFDLVPHLAADLADLDGLPAA